jgi:hypothetical protein
MAVATTIAAISAATDITKSMRFTRHLLLCEVAGCTTGSLRPRCLIFRTKFLASTSLAKTMTASSKCVNTFVNNVTSINATNNNNWFVLAHESKMHAHRGRALVASIHSIAERNCLETPTHEPSASPSGDSSPHRRTLRWWRTTARSPYSSGGSDLTTRRCVPRPIGEAKPRTP